MKRGKRMKGKHYNLCLINNPNCKCLICEKDNFIRGITLKFNNCCTLHLKNNGIRTCPVKDCPDYTKETEQAEVKTNWYTEMSEEERQSTILNLIMDVGKEGQAHDKS